MSAAAGNEPEILIVDDDASLARSYENILREEGFDHVSRCTDSRQALGAIRERPVGVVVLDLSMPHVSGREILLEIRRQHPSVIVVIATAVMEIATAVECMKNGALDYLVKPVDRPRLVATVRRALEVYDLRRENAELKDRLLDRTLRHAEAFSALITQDERMLSMFLYAESVAVSPEPVLITGETGVGKDLLARAIHDVSGRRGEFVTVNIAGIDDHVFADTLFGHLRGAFTGADAARAGLVETASGGTLFLDEIGDIAPASQVKLLRFLHDGEYFPLGSDAPRKSGARIIAATNKKLSELVRSGKFREDLYYRLQAHHIEIPPLRERVRDIPLLAKHFAEEAAAALNKPAPRFEIETLELLERHPFPGNVRELRSMIFDAVARLQSSELAPSCFPCDMASSAQDAHSASDGIVFPARLPTVRDASLQLVREALRRTGNNQAAAAKLAGISRQTMNRYCRILGIGQESHS